MAAPPDKRVTIDEIVGEVRDGMTVGIGGWGSRRKPMALVRALLRSPVRDLRIVSYGGPDVGLLCRAGKVREVVYAFVSLDSIALEPHFRNARQSGYLSLLAAAWRVPFLPTRVGLGSDVMRLNPQLRNVRSPYDDGEELVAMPALDLDVALIHMHRGDRGGTGQFLGVDPYFDDLMCMAAIRRFMSVERIVDTGDFLTEGPVQSIRINRLMTDGVVEAPRGAHFTECVPDYARDEAFQREYVASAKSDDAWEAFRSRYIDVTEREYQDAVEAVSA